MVVEHLFVAWGWGGLVRVGEENRCDREEDGGVVGMSCCLSCQSELGRYCLLRFVCADER